MHSDDLARRLQDQPFQPFRIKMLNSTVFDVTEPWMVIAGETSAVVVTRVREDRERHIALDWRTIAIDHITEFSDLPAKKDGKTKSK